MSQSAVPEARIHEPSPGVLVYEQNPYSWAKNSGQTVYQESITLGAPEEGSLNAAPALAIISGDRYFSSRDAGLMERMFCILKAANLDGVIDTHEMLALSRIIRDAADDGELNGSVPNMLVGGK